MHFVNTTKNSVNLVDIGIIIPFFEDLSEQYISTDNVARSLIFRKMCDSNPSQFIITKIELGSRIEENLLIGQQNRLQPSHIDHINIKLTFRGHVSGYSGSSKANRNIVYALARQGVDICLEPMSGIEKLSVAEMACLKRFKTIPDPDSILLHSTIPTFGTEPEHRYSILYTTIESTTIPKQFIDACQPYSEIWVTSDFCKKVLLEAGLKKDVYVVPNSVDSRIYTPNGKKHIFQPPLKEFKFVSVFSWNYRKGFDALLKSYLRAFDASDPVSLLIVTPYQYHKNEIKDDIGDIIADTVRGNHTHAHIARCGYPIIEADMPKMYRACDAFVLPSRGEGFGLPYMEAGLCGLPIIATNHSGHTMFLNKENSSLTDIDHFTQIDSGCTGVHYWDNQLFPALDSDDFIDRFSKDMRFVFEHYNESKVKNKILQDDILKGYTCEIVGSVAKKRLEEIWNQL